MSKKPVKVTTKILQDSEVGRVFSRGQISQITHHKINIRHPRSGIASVTSSDPNSRHQNSVSDNQSKTQSNEAQNSKSTWSWSQQHSHSGPSTNAQNSDRNVNNADNSESGQGRDMRGHGQRIPEDESENPATRNNTRGSLIKTPGATSEFFDDNSSELNNMPNDSQFGPESSNSIRSSNTQPKIESSETRNPSQLESQNPNTRRSSNVPSQRDSRRTTDPSQFQVEKSNSRMPSNTQSQRSERDRVRSSTHSNRHSTPLHPSRSNTSNWASPTGSGTSSAFTTVSSTTIFDHDEQNNSKEALDNSSSDLAESTWVPFVFLLIFLWLGVLTYYGFGGSTSSVAESGSKLSADSIFGTYDGECG